MGCINSITYVQRQIDKILRPIKDFARAYINNVVYGSKSLSEYISQLRKLFTLLTEAGVSISLKKTFLGYPSVSLLR